MLSRCVPFILLPFLLIGCTPPLTALKSSGGVVLNVSIGGHHLQDPEAQIRFEKGIRAALAQELGPELRVVEARSGPELPSIQVTLLWPESAETPTPREALGTHVGKMAEQALTLGLAPRTLEDRMALIGVDRDAFRNYQAEMESKGFFEWGPAENAAKRARIKQLGFTPFLLSGQFRIVEAGGRRGLGTGLFLGWESVNYMDPLPSTPEAPTEAQVMQASARGLARLLRKRWS
ncbi:MAG TPA: hypothetical protein VJ505_10435 [Holophagaceae bacterium]|nr:hypothetical protein [Holophagaceae bacterium]